MTDAERIRKRLPDYFKAIEMPWNFASSFLSKFVDDDEQQIGVPGNHSRNLFHVAKALDQELAALRADRATLQAEWDGAHERYQAHIESLTKDREDVRARLDYAERTRAALAERGTKMDEALEEAKKAIETFFHHWQHGGISRDNQFHQQTAYQLGTAARMIGALYQAHAPNAEAVNPCPFCGKHDGVEVKSVDSAWVECHWCDVQGPGANTRALAIAAWNRRATNESARKC